MGKVPKFTKSAKSAVPVKRLGAKKSKKCLVEEEREKAIALKMLEEMENRSAIARSERAKNPSQAVSCPPPGKNHPASNGGLFRVALHISADLTNRESGDLVYDAILNREANNQSSVEWGSESDDW